MIETSIFWSREQFIAYLMLYVAQSDLVKTPEEKDLIRARIGEQCLREMEELLSKDNDYQSIQRILAYVDAKKFSSDDIDRLMDDIRQLCMADGKYDILEQNLTREIRRLLS